MPFGPNALVPSAAMHAVREALPRPLTHGISGTLLLASSGAMLAAALFLGGGSRDDRLALLGAVAVTVAGIGWVVALLGRLLVPRLDRWVWSFLGLLAAVVLWSGLSVWWSIGPDFMWCYTNHKIT